MALYFDFLFTGKNANILSSLHISSSHFRAIKIHKLIAYAHRALINSPWQLNGASVLPGVSSTGQAVLPGAENTPLPAGGEDLFTCVIFEKLKMEMLKETEVCFRGSRSSKGILNEVRIH